MTGDVPLGQGARVGPYVVDAVVGVGGDHLTYRAIQADTGRQLALKEFKPAGWVVRAADGRALVPRAPEDAATLEKLVADIEAQNRGRERFRHPNVIAIFDVVAANGTVYLAMDRYPGQPLSALLGPGEALDRNEVDEILAPLLDGLAALHEDGLVHLDICPASLFVRRDGRPMLGRATLHPAAHRVEGRSFVLNEDDAYFAEEHFFPEIPFGPWTDIYGLSAAFYRLIAGAPPANVVKRIKETARSRPDPALTGIEGLRSQWHDELLDTLARGLAIEAGDRWASVEQFRASLDGPPGMRRAPANDHDAAVPAGEALPAPDVDEEEDGPSTVRVTREPDRAEAVAADEVVVQPSGRVAEPEVPSHPPLRLYRGGKMTVEPGPAPAEGAGPKVSAAAADAERLGPRFTLFAPARPAPGTWQPAGLYLHEPGLETAVRRLHARDPAQANPVRPRDAARIALGPGAPVSLVPETESLAVNPSRVTVAWHENIHRVDFRLQAVPGAAATDETVDRLLCFVGPVLVGEVPLAGPEAAGAEGSAGHTASGFTRVYLCAAEEDRAVATAIDEAVRHLRMPFIGECAALRAKPEWDREIFRKIEEAEVFLLFWSEAAAKSERIRKEWEFAADLDRDRFVRIVRLRADAAAPPPDLAMAPRHRVQLP